MCLGFFGVVLGLVFYLYFVDVFVGFFFGLVSFGVFLMIFGH